MKTNTLKFLKSKIEERVPKSNELIELSGLIKEVDGNKLTIDIFAISLTEYDNFSGSTSGSDFNIPITIDIG